MVTQKESTRSHFPFAVQVEKRPLGVRRPRATINACHRASPSPFLMLVTENTPSAPCRNMKRRSKWLEENRFASPWVSRLRR